MTERTRGKRPDYRILHTSGEVVLKQSGYIQREQASSEEEYYSVEDSSGDQKDQKEESSSIVEHQLIKVAFEAYRDQALESSSSDSSHSVGEVSEDVLESSQILEDSVAAREATERTKMEQLEAMMNQLSIQEATVADDIDDFLEENPVEDARNSLEDLDAIIKRTEELRSEYRWKHKELLTYLKDAYAEKYGKEYAARIDRMKNRIMFAKNQRKP